MGAVVMASRFVPRPAAEDSWVWSSKSSAFNLLSQTLQLYAPAPQKQFLVPFETIWVGGIRNVPRVLSDPPSDTLFIGNGRIWI